MGALYVQPGDGSWRGSNRVYVKPPRFRESTWVRVQNLWYRQADGTWTSAALPREPGQPGVSQIATYTQFYSYDGTLTNGYYVTTCTFSVNASTYSVQPWQGEPGRFFSEYDAINTTPGGSYSLEVIAEHETRTWEFYIQAFGEPGLAGVQGYGAYVSTY